MAEIDLNLLVALDRLLAENSVTGAARALGLSPSAMSRTLARLRATTGDPLLVRAGRGLVPTPRAIALRGEVPHLVRAARGLLSPRADRLDLATLERTFTLRANDGFIQAFAAALVVTVAEAAPGARLRFAPRPDKNGAPLREGAIDLDIGVMGASAPELRTQLLFRDRFVGVVRTGHPLLSAPITAERYAACRHVVTSRRGQIAGPVDEALAAMGLARRVVAVVPGFADALRIAARSDLVALVPGLSLGQDADGLHRFDLPVATPEIAIAALWHPRMDADPAHRWLRDTVATLCRAMARGG